MSLVLSGDSGVSFNDGSQQGAAASPYGLKNRLINSDMRIDQRNAGASFTPTDGSYGLDRWWFGLTQASKFTAQQNAGSVTPPAGFTNYLGITSSSAYSIGAGDIFYVNQKIEGYNVADLDFGKSTAKTITLSFWVRSSLTGSFSASISNSATTRVYAFTYSISSANTWEQKTVTITGDTSGTWLTTNGTGLYVQFNLALGSNFATTANTWTTSGYGVSGQTSVVGTNGATWYVTGTQLEVGSTATPFERRMYTNELQLCQRYYYKHANSSNPPIGIAFSYANTSVTVGVFLKQPMRASPTLDCTTGTDYYTYQRNGGTDGFNSFTVDQTSQNFVTMFNSSEISGTAGQAGLVYAGSGSVAFTAEL